MSRDAKYYAAVEATWPPVTTHAIGCITVREGRGGGSRVSSATADGLPDLATLRQAEAEMRAVRQTPQFMIRKGETLLDQLLEAQGYRIKDPVTLYTVAAAKLADIVIPRVTTFCIWPPLAIQKEIWTAGGISDRRFAVMERVVGAKTAILGRIDDQPAGTAFVAQHDDIAMLHGLEIAPEHRRKGLAGWMMRQAGQWAKRNGAYELAVAVTQANQAANHLYQSLGMDVVGHYHYRILEENA
ncbi:GNAT family N-acetyltransferase [Epibacterium ulvae]|uniref:GNAT family N-acetyltransferase n=1 Tax=Epibacterium ulvae TaxID=1156985 RepID=UPI0024909146|nr:GNAT family N-acetyltransferase [Epibacterium ulvae]